MGRIPLPDNSANSFVATGPLLIGVGLGSLLASVWLPVPVVTAMAILTLGATDVTVARFSRLPVLVPIIILHAVAYVGLYGLFIGATLHAAASVSDSPSAAPMLDIAISIVPMAVALQHALVGLRQQFASRR